MSSSERNPGAEQPDTGQGRYRRRALWVAGLGLLAVLALAGAALSPWSGGDDKSASATTPFGVAVQAKPANGANQLPVSVTKVFGSNIDAKTYGELIAAQEDQGVDLQGRMISDLSPLAPRAFNRPVARYKTIAFAVSGCYGGISGGLYAAIAGFINPEAFSFGVSINYVTMTVVGGIGTLSGPVIGAFVLTLLPEALRAYAEYKEFVAGLILLVFIVVLPGGLVGFGRNLTGRLLRGIPV